MRDLRLNLTTIALAAFTLAMAACSPAFNWRDVRPDDTRLSLLMPCKPDKAEKTVPLGSQPTSLRMLGCDAGGLTFAISSADIGSAEQVPSVLAAWQKATLANMQAAKADSTTPLKLAGASGGQGVWLKATGKRADGTAVVGYAAYFAQDATVFQAVIYGADIKADVADTYFSGLKFE